MAMIEVTLRVVGIFFNRTIKFEGGDQPKIKNLLEEARRQFPIEETNGFDYDATSGGVRPSSLIYFSHNFSGLYDYNADGSISPGEGKTLSGKTRSPGLYKLQEQDIEGGGLGWQSYIIRDGQLASKTLVAGGFVYFSEQNILGGDEVIWRLVAIGKRRVLPLVQSVA